MALGSVAKDSLSIPNEKIIVVNYVIFWTVGYISTIRIMKMFDDLALSVCKHNGEWFVI